MGANSELARQWSEAMGAGDVDTLRSMCARGAVLRENGGAPVSLLESLDGVLLLKRAFPDFRHENAVRVDSDEGFVSEHDAVCTLPDGTPFRARACVVAKVRDGKITSMHEYADTAAEKPLMAVFGR